MSRSPQESTACKLPFKCCVFVISSFIYLPIKFWFNQKPPSTCYTTSVVGLLQSFLIVMLLSLLRHKILPQKQLGPCIKSLALLLHRSLVGATFIFKRNHLLLHTWTLNLLLLCPALLLWRLPRIRGANCSVLRTTIALLVRVSLWLMLRLSTMLRESLAVAVHLLGPLGLHLSLCHERAVPSYCESNPLHISRLTVVFGLLHYVLLVYALLSYAHHSALLYTWVLALLILCSTHFPHALVPIPMPPVVFLPILPLSSLLGGPVATSESLDGLSSSLWRSLSGSGTTIWAALSGLTLSGLGSTIWATLSGLTLSGLGSTIWTALSGLTLSGLGSTIWATLSGLSLSGQEPTTWSALLVYTLCTYLSCLGSTPSPVLYGLPSVHTVIGLNLLLLATTMPPQPDASQRPRRHWSFIELPTPATLLLPQSATRRHRPTRKQRRRAALVRNCIRMAARPSTLDQIWVRLPIPKGRLLGGMPPGHSAKLIRRPSSLLPHARVTEDIPELNSDEDWWPMYVLAASTLAASGHDYPHEREILTKDAFSVLPGTHWQHELTAMGIDFNTTGPVILQLLPSITSIRLQYADLEAPPIDVSYLTLEEVLSHVRVVYHRIFRLKKTRTKTQKLLSRLHASVRKRRGFVAQGPSLQDQIDIQWLMLARTRKSIRQHTELHDRLCRKVKARLRESSKALPKTVRVPCDLPPIPTWNRFTLLDESDSLVRTWRDFLPPPQEVNTSVPTPPRTTYLPHHEPPLQAPLEALFQLRHDLGDLGSSSLHQAGTMAYGVQGCFKSPHAQSRATIQVSTWNVNSLTAHKAHFITQLMLQDKTDVFICTDTRHTDITVRSFRRLFSAGLGPGTKTYFSNDPNRRSGEPGGITIVIGPRWGPSYIPDTGRTDYSGHGILARVHIQTVTGIISILGTYWPCVPSGHSESTAGDCKLYNRVKAYLAAQHHRDPDPIQYVQSLILQWIQSAWTAGCEGIILGGDLNSRWAGTHGGQRSISQWASSNYLINGPLQIAERCGATFVTCGHIDHGCGTWIDHLLHAGDLSRIDIVGAFNDTGPLLDGYSDHRPLIASYHTSCHATPAITTMPKPRKRPELPRGDKRQIAVFKNEMNAALSQIPFTCATSRDAETALELFTQFTVHLTRMVNTLFSGGSKRRKDGYSPEFVLRKFHLAAVIDIKRHMFSLHGYQQWVGYNTMQNGIRYIFRVLEGRGSGLGLSTAHIARVLDVPGATQDFWLSLPTGPTALLCDKAIRLLRNRMHGRQRTDMRLAHQGFMSYIESQREKGRLGAVIKATLGAHAGRRHQDGLVMDNITLDGGVILTDPLSIHSANTTHYEAFYKTPKDFDNDLHSAQDWRPYVQDKASFDMLFESSNIPQWCLDIIHAALQPKPKADIVHQQLTAALRDPPTLAEFKKGIQKCKTNSAPGMSGLSYNMLKSLPENAIEYVYDKLCFFWQTTDVPASFQWRWLKQIPKKLVDHMGLNDYRGLMLCEVLRKIWGSQSLRRVMGAIRHHATLETNHHGFEPGRGTDTATIIHQNMVEDTEEKSAVSHQTSFDLAKAFDSTSKGLMDWSWRRLGVPEQAAKCFVQIDVDGTTVVRSPYAEYMWDVLPYRCVRTTGRYPPETLAADDASAIVDALSPERGTGQGDPISVSNWVAVADIPATALRMLDDQSNNPIYVSAEDNQVYKHCDLFYADDMKGSHQLSTYIQRKADLLSACCIVLGLKLSESKIRRVLQDFLPGPVKHAAEDMVIHTAGWIPHRVPIQDSGHTEFLGGLYDADNRGDATFDWLQAKANLHVHCTITRKGFSAESKLSVLSSSTLNSLGYKAACSVLSHQQLQAIDTILEKAYVPTTKNMGSYPRKLLYIPRKYGGLGIQCFSIMASMRKLHKLFGCLRSCQLHSLAAKGLLNRLARKHGYVLTRNQGVVITPRPLGSQDYKIYMDGPFTLLQAHHLTICRAGNLVSSSSLECSLPTIIPAEDIELRNFCYTHSFFTIADLTHEIHGRREWFLEGPLERLRSALPSIVPTSTIPLLQGQYWRVRNKIQDTLAYNDVVRIDGCLGENVLVRRFQYTSSAGTVRLTEQSITIPYLSLFPTSSALRCSLVYKSRHIYSVVYQREQSRPEWVILPDKTTPPWIAWIADALQHLGPNYIARPYTDGSYKKLAGISGFFRPLTAQVNATAAIILKDDTADWRTKPILAVHIANGADLEPESVYTMEYLALAGAMQLSVFNIDRIHATGSDAKSVLQQLEHRRQRLQNVFHDHHYLLQCIDNALYSGAPMPYYVQSHAENRKSAKDSDGCYGLSWNKDDWGNWIADRVAAKDYDILRKHKLNIRHITIDARDLYTALKYAGQWYIGYQNGRPVLPKGAASVIYSSLNAQYLVERDEFRLKRGDLPKWVRDSSMPHSAMVYRLTRAGAAIASMKSRIIFDKGYHGGNRAKNDRLTDSERTKTRECVLCGLPDSQDHWLHSCDFPACRKIRAEVLTDLNKKLLDYRELSALHRQLGQGFKDVLTTTAEPARIWTGNWSTCQIASLSAMYNTELTRDLEMSKLEAILGPLERILADGAINLWHCKVVNEKILSRSDNTKRVTPCPLRMKPDGGTPPLPSGSKKQSPPTKQQLRRDTVGLQASGPACTSLALSFPPIPAAVRKRLTAAQHCKQLARTIVTIDGEYGITGSMFQRLCGDKNGCLYEGGRLHPITLRAFLRLLQLDHKGRLLVIDESATDLILASNYAAALHTRRNAYLHTEANHGTEWIYILLSDKSDTKDITWALSVINVQTRHIAYYSITSEANPVSQRDTNHINSLLSAYDLLLPVRPSVAWTMQTHYYPIIQRQESGVWICITAQGIVHGHDKPLCDHLVFADSRRYIATCLLQSALPDFDSLLITTLRNQSTQTTAAGNNDMDTLTGVVPHADSPCPVDPDMSAKPPPPDSDYTALTYMWGNLSTEDWHRLHAASTTQNSSTIWQYTGLHPDAAESLHIQGMDIRDLIQPTKLRSNVVDYILQLLYPATHPDVLYVGMDFTQCLSGEYISVDQIATNPILQPQMDVILSQIFSKQCVVFTFNIDDHFIGVTMHRHRSSATHITLHYLDSLKWNGDRIIRSISAFIMCCAQSAGIELRSSDITIVSQAASNMATQLPYRERKLNCNTEVHIDCGLYIILMIILNTQSISLESISPPLVHSLRPHLALALLQNTVTALLASWLLRHSDAVSSQSDHPEPSQHHSSTVEVSAISLPPGRSRSHLGRRAKAHVYTDKQYALPLGREVIHIPIADHAQTHTYAALSTLNDPSLGIDAGLGLFASRPHSDDIRVQPIDDGDLVGFYTSSRPLTVAEVEDYMYNPSPDTPTGYMIIFQQLAADGWNKARGTYSSMTALLNDPCDKDLYNSTWTKERKRDRSGKAIGSPCIAVRTITGLTVPTHGEFFIEYGHSSFCRASLPLQVLFKAMTHYYDAIRKDTSGSWERLPQARILFNSPYHTCAPSIQPLIIARLIRHLEQCTDTTCYCSLASYLDTIASIRTIPAESLPEPLPLRCVDATSDRRADPDASSHCSIPVCKKAKLIPIMPDTIQTPMPMNTNAQYDDNLRVLPDSSLPDAGLGVQFTTDMPQGAIVGIYINANTVKRINCSRIMNRTHMSNYAVRYVDGDIDISKDAWDPITNTVSCPVARLNDPLDETKDNTEFFVHPLKPSILLVRTTTPVLANDWGYLPYGGSYWCDPQYGLDLHLRAIRRYSINIHTSTESTDGDWRALPTFPILATHFPNPCTARLPILPDDTQRHATTAIPVDTFPNSYAILLIGMFYGDHRCSKTLQIGRDYYRCRALEMQQQQRVFTIDSGHFSENSMAGRHIQHDFSDYGVLRKMDTTWTGVVFTHVIIDYFYTPNSWHEERFKEDMYTSILPAMAKGGALSPDCEIWLPHITCIQDRLQRLRPQLSPYFHTASDIADPYINPLFQATHTIEDQLRTIGPLTNLTAINSLDKATPFIRLRCDATAISLPVLGCGKLCSIQPNTIYSLRTRKPIQSQALSSYISTTRLDTIPPEKTRTSQSENQYAIEEVKVDEESHSIVQHHRSNVLLLGMFYGSDGGTLKYQIGRDYYRCRALEASGDYCVYTIDIGKARELAADGRHIQHDFGTYGVLAEMDKHWKGIAFSHVIMDYFYTPTSWHEEHWKEDMYTLTLNTMAERGALLPSCEIWLPHIRCISERLERLRPRLSHLFETECSVSNPYLNPLYAATQNIDDILKQIGTFNNATALEELHAISPFLLLKCRDYDPDYLPAVGCGNLSHIQTSASTALSRLRPRMIHTDSRLPQHTLCFPTVTASSERLNQICDTSGDNPIRTDGPPENPDQIYPRALRHLRDGQLTDATVSAYLRVLCELGPTSLARCETLDPLYSAYILQAYEVRDLVRDSNADFGRRRVFDCDYLFVPLTTQGHTSLLTVNFIDNSILHEDPLHGTHTNSDVYTKRLLSFLRSHWTWKYGTLQGFPTAWSCRVAPRSTVPQQSDGTSCGVFSCAFATLHSLRIPTMYFTQTHVPRMRLHMANCILYYISPPLTLTGHHVTLPWSRRQTLAEINRHREITTNNPRNSRKRQRQESLPLPPTTLIDLTEGHRPPKLLRAYHCEPEFTNDSKELPADDHPFHLEQLPQLELLTVISDSTATANKSNIRARARRISAKPTSSQTAHENDQDQATLLLTDCPRIPALENAITHSSPTPSTRVTTDLITDTSLLLPSLLQAATRVGAKRKPKHRHPTKVARQRTLDDYVPITTRQQGTRRPRKAMEGAAQDDRIDSVDPDCHVLIDMTDMTEITAVSLPAIDRPTKRQKPESSLAGDQSTIDSVVIETEEQQAPPLSSTLEYDKGIVFS